MQVNFTDPQSKTTLGGKPVYGMFFQGDDSHGMHYVGQVHPTLPPALRVTAARARSLR